MTTDLTNEGILMKARVETWRDVSLYADMAGERRLADGLWKMVEERDKEAFKRIVFHTHRVVATIRRIATTHGLEIIEMPP